MNWSGILKDLEKDWTRISSVQGKKKEDLLLELGNVRVGQLEGEIWECGVFNGGTAALLAKNFPKKTVRLFDSFEGMKEVHSKDNHCKVGMFKPKVDYKRMIDHFKKTYPNAVFHKGWIPDTFQGLEDSQIAFCHIDLDLYLGYKDALEFVYPRMNPDGIIVLDDYNFERTKGAKIAADEFFADKSQKIKLLPNGSSAVVYLS
jgi:O-methyltransferase